MAARTRLSLLFPQNRPPFRHHKLIHTEAVVKEPANPPIVPSFTAKSKSARRRQVGEQVKKICASAVQEKLSLITRIQREKFVVYPQTFARNADRWYQHFTKTAYIPGLPEKFTQGQKQTAREDGSPQAAAHTTVPGMEDDAFADIRALVTRVILQEHWHLKKRRPFLYREQEQMVGPFLRNLVTGLTYSLAKYNPLLQLSSLGMDDRGARRSHMLYLNESSKCRNVPCHEVKVLHSKLYLSKCIIWTMCSLKINGPCECYRLY